MLLLLLLSQPPLTLPKLQPFFVRAVSRPAGIPDFRGKDGVWTLEEQGQPLPDYEKCWDNAMPTLGHMALVGLVNEGIVTAVISQNVDGEKVDGGGRHTCWCCHRRTPLAGLPAYAKSRRIFSEKSYALSRGQQQSRVEHAWHRTAKGQPFTAVVGVAL